MKCFEIYDQFVLNRDHLLDESWLISFLNPHCSTKILGLSDSPLQIRQNPKELARYLIFMGRQQTNSYLEIGLLMGGSWFTVDSYLRAVNPHYCRTIGYDRRNRLRNWGEYRQKFSNIDFRLQNSKDISLKGEQFDMAFIDAKHTKEAVLHDFEKVKPHCKYVAFHDIVHPDVGASKAWMIIRLQFNKYWEFVDTSVPNTCGIGVVLVNDFIEQYICS